MTRRALVTGGHGFVAQWAIRAMLERGWSVTAAGLGSATAGGPLDASHRDAVWWEELDVTNQEQVGAVVERAVPDVVLHL
ncbi:MAG: NAD-dependent epimerase/dehydratase family protein, partial [Gemmatimonadaceae bacterium]